MRFEALERSIDLVRALRRPLETLRARDPGLAKQIREAASSVPLNIAEGARRQGRDRRQHFLIAAGSAAEVRTGLRVAEAWGDLDASGIQEAMRTVDRVLGLLWGLSH